MVFVLTRPEVRDALIAAQARGVAVRVLVSSRFAGEPVIADLIAAGVPVRQTTVHAKVLVVDGERVLTGSANWSAGAWANNETALFIDDLGLASSFEADVDRTWTSASP